jgi:hypothetical protein
MVLEIVRQTLYDFSALFCSKIQKLPLRCPGVLRTFKPGKKLPCSWARTGIRTYKIPRYAEKKQTSTSLCFARLFSCENQLSNETWEYCLCGHLTTENGDEELVCLNASHILEAQMTPSLAACMNKLQSSGQIPKPAKSKSSSSS